VSNLPAREIIPQPTLPGGHRAASCLSWLYRWDAG